MPQAPSTRGIGIPLAGMPMLADRCGAGAEFGRQSRATAPQVTGVGRRTMARPVPAAQRTASPGGGIASWRRVLLFVALVRRLFPAPTLGSGLSAGLEPGHLTQTAPWACATCH